jgi:hypothetical protein
MLAWGKWSKMIKSKFDEHFGEIPDLWTKDGLLSAADRRLLFVKWLSESWEDVTENRQEQITKAFQRCGMLNAIAGSEDHLIKIKGYEGPYSLEGESDPENDSDSELPDDSHFDSDVPLHVSDSDSADSDDDDLPLSDVFSKMKK